MARFYGDLSAYDDTVVPDLEVVQRVSPVVEMGVTGLKRAGGVIDEEYLPALRGRKAVKVYQEMSLNDPVVTALLFTIKQLLRQLTWRVEAPGNSPDGQEAAQFVESCMEDMSHSWGDMISEILSMLVYGWSWHEITYKRRIGPWEKDPKRKSKYTDGMYGWRKIAIRSQETMVRWIFDDQGGVKAMVQLAPPHYKTTVIPIEKSLLFRPEEYKGSPEGLSLLRGAYRPWFFKKRLEEFEAIGIERDLAGMPVAKVPAEYMTAAPGTAQHRTFQAFRKLVSGVRRDEHEGLVLPNQYDPETKQPLFEFELMSAGGSRQFDTSAIIQRYEQRILMTVLADFIMLGQTGTGSYALHVDKTGIFRAALNAIAQSIADVFNRHAIPRLFELNGWHPEELPKLVADNVDAPDLNQLSTFMSTMGGLGMEWFPDPELEKFLRKVSGLPDMSDERMEMLRMMAEQNDMMNFTNSQMMSDLVGQGHTPAQAQMLAESPTPEVLAQQQWAQYKGSSMAEQDPDVQAMKQREMDQQFMDPMAAQNQDFEREKMQHESEMVGANLEAEKEKMTLQELMARFGHEREKEKTQLQSGVPENAKFQSSEGDKSRQHERSKMSHDERMARYKLQQAKQVKTQKDKKK